MLNIYYKIELKNGLMLYHKGNTDQPIMPYKNDLMHLFVNACAVINCLYQLSVQEQRQIILDVPKNLSEYLYALKDKECSDAILIETKRLLRCFNPYTDSFTFCGYPAY